MHDVAVQVNVVSLQVHAIAVHIPVVPLQVHDAAVKIPDTVVRVALGTEAVQVAPNSLCDSVAVAIRAALVESE